MVEIVGGGEGEHGVTSCVYGSGLRQGSPGISANSMSPADGSYIIRMCSSAKQ